MYVDGMGLKCDLPKNSYYHFDQSHPNYIIYRPSDETPRLHYLYSMTALLIILDSIIPSGIFKGESKVKVGWR